MSEEKKTSTKKTESEKKLEKDQMINLWMNNMESDQPKDKTDSDSQKKASD